MKTLEASTNQTLNVTLKNNFGATAVYSMKVHFLCSALESVPYFIIPVKKITVSKVKILKPVRITSISRRGVVEVQFFKSVQSPNLKTLD